MVSRPFFIALLPVLSFLGGCSASGGSGDPGGAGGSGGSSGSGATCPPDPNWNGAMPMVSLKNDLLADVSTQKPAGGVFRRACAASSCHDEQNPEAELFISPPAKNPMTQEPIVLTAEHRMRFLGTTDGVKRPSLTAPSMPIVDPTKPANSFLMRKLDGCWSGLDGMGQCTPLENGPTPCGETMPFGGMLLDAAERDMIRRWIFQGAQDN